MSSRKPAWLKFPCLADYCLKLPFVPSEQLWLYSHLCGSPSRAQTLKWKPTSPPTSGQVGVSPLKCVELLLLLLLFLIFFLFSFFKIFCTLATGIREAFPACCPWAPAFTIFILVDFSPSSHQASRGPVWITTDPCDWGCSSWSAQEVRNHAGVPNLYFTLSSILL